MNQIYPAIRTMTWDETIEAGLFNPGQVMDCNRVSYRLSAGSSDDIHVFKSGAIIYVLAMNARLEYLGLDAYMAGEEDPIDNIFLQGEWAIQECLGERWRSFSAVTIVSRLKPYFN